MRTDANNIRQTILKPHMRTPTSKSRASPRFCAPYSVRSYPSPVGSDMSPLSPSFAAPSKAPCRLCNCKKSNCLKLYCDCFASGEYCTNCNCVACYNNAQHEKTRQEAIRSILERNPHAFRPKISSTLAMQASPTFTPVEPATVGKHSKVRKLSPQNMLGMCVQEVGVPQEVLRMLQRRDRLLGELSMCGVQERGVRDGAGSDP